MFYLIGFPHSTGSNIYRDHSWTKKSPNNHRLPPACTRCKRLFEDEASAREHEKELRSDPPCPILNDEELRSKNSQLNRKGISDSRRKEINEALNRFRKTELPVGCDPHFFRDWVARNVPLYIGRSDKTGADARRELGKWLVIFFTQFPGEKVPSNPCKQGNLIVADRKLIKASHGRL
jgi:hypothetical protein